MIDARIETQGPYKKIVCLLAIAAATLVVSQFATPYMGLATASYLLLVFGIQFRKSDRRLHGLLMGGGVAGDLTLVGVLEIQRHAINTAVSLTLSPLQQAHVVCSTIAAVLYIPTVILGIYLMTRPQLRERYRGPHMRVAIAAFVFRSAGFLLMFSMLKGHLR